MGDTMSWQYYINMEPMALEIANSHIQLMSDKVKSKLWRKLPSGAMHQAGM
jgi:hypothetical protein